MKKLFAVAVCLLSAGLLAGCGGGGPAAAPAIGVAFPPGTPQGIDQGQTQSFTANVSNDSSNKGVAWSATCSAADCGSFNPTSTPSGTGTMYKAPNNPGLMVTVKAASVADMSKSASTVVTVNPTPTVSMPTGCTTPPCALPPATPGTAYSVSLPMVLNLTGGTAPFTWRVIMGSLPAGLALNMSTGVISGTPMTTRPGSFVTGQATIGTPSNFSVQATDSGGSPPIPQPALMLSITVQIGVTLSPNTPQTVPQGQTLSITATVTNDPQNAGVTWTATCSTSPCGSFSPTSTPSGTPTTYTAPSPVSTNLAVTVTATSVTDNTRSASLMVTVTPPPPISVSVAPTTASVVVSRTAQFTATVMNDPANNGVTWTLTQGGTACSPTCGIVSPVSTLTGVPTTYTAPATVPTPATVTLTATSVTDTTKFASATITVTTSNNGALLGDFAFEFTGFADSGGEVAVNGRFHADGNGNLTAGSWDSNTPTGVVNTTFTGTYSVGGDNRCTLIANLATGTTFIAKCVLLVTPSETKVGHIIEFDDSSGMGTRGSGEIHKQDLTAATFSVLNGDFALGFFGDFNGISVARLGVVGRFTLGTTGTFSAGFVDVSAPGSSFPSPLTGSLNSPDASTGRGTGMVTITVPSPPAPGAPINLTMHVAYYVVGKHTAFVVVIDAQSSTSPLLSGFVQKQRQPTFSLASITGPIVFAEVGTCGSGATAQASVSVGQVVADGLGNARGFFDENDCGTVGSNVPITATATMDPMVKGRFTVTLVTATGAKPHMLYLRDIDKGFLLEGTATTPGNEVTGGIIGPQTIPTGGFTEASIAGTYGFSTVAPSTTNVSDVSGVVTLTSNAPSTFDGTSDSSIPVSPFLIPNGVTTATYSLTDGMVGRFTVTSTTTGVPFSLVIYAVDTGTLVSIRVDASFTAAPVIFYDK